MMIVMTAVVAVALGAAGAAGARQQPASGTPAPAAQVAPAKTVTIVGTVVDAACYMMHPAAADNRSHKECGTACIARGVPVAIANEADKTLYFLADGAGLAKLLHQRVRATGTVTQKAEPMELKMPVGERNEMIVRVEGGYKVMAIDKFAAAPRRR